MTNFFNRFINCTSPNATIGQVVDHIDHMVRVAGIDHVGIGADYDGVGNQLPIGLGDVSRYPYLVEELIIRGYSDADIIKIIGGNLLRAFKKAEDVAYMMRTEFTAEAIIDYNFTVIDPCRTGY